MPDIATRSGYDLSNEGDDQGPPSDLSVFTRDSDGPETKLYCSQSEVEDFERYEADGGSPLLTDDTISVELFAKFSAWLHENIEGGIHSFEYWTKLTDDEGFASHLGQRHAEAKLRMEQAIIEKSGARAADEHIKVLALERVAELYGINL